MQSPTVRVGLLWHSLDAGNLGLRALTLSHLALLDRVALASGRKVEALLFGQPPWEGLPASSFRGTNATLAGRSDLSGYALTRGIRATAAAMRRCDMLIDISEGDGFTDLYGGRRYLKQLAAKWLALRSGRPLVLAPQTIGPFASRVSEQAAAAVLSRAACVFSRDRASAEYARQLGAPEVEEAIDLAFALPYEPSPRVPGRLRIGLNLSGLLYRAKPGEFGLSLSYPHLADLLIQTLLRDDKDVFLVPHVSSRPGTIDDDVACCRTLVSRYPRLQMSPAFPDPRDAKSFVASLDFFVGTRLHACIAAYSTGVPLLPLAYSRKTTGLFGSLAYPVVADMTRASAEEVASHASEAFARREALCRSIRSGNEEAQRRLARYTDRLTGMLAACG